MQASAERGVTSAARPATVARYSLVALTFNQMSECDSNHSPKLLNVRDCPAYLHEATPAADRRMQTQPSPFHTGKHPIRRFSRLRFLSYF
jgi:hypothetical protein